MTETFWQYKKSIVHFEEEGLATLISNTWTATNELTYDGIYSMGWNMSGITDNLIVYSYKLPSFSNKREKPVRQRLNCLEVDRVWRQVCTSTSNLSQILLTVKVTLLAFPYARTSGVA